MKSPLRTAVFAGFELDLSAGELSNGEGKLVRLPEQPLRILVLLLEHAGEVVSREELRQRLWPNDTVVEFEHSISAAMNRLRQALGDSAEEPRYIETLARRGYRCKVEVEWREPAASQASAGDGSLIGQKVAHYRILEVLGGGGMGIVYKAEDLKLGRRVALKFLPEEWLKHAGARERFAREARAASSLNHPNICTIYGVEEHEGKPFMVMELLEGQTLRERLAAGKRMRPQELLTIASQIACGLEAAHRGGIIHRDIKPANIFISQEDRVKILDFGLAKQALAGAAAVTGATDNLTITGPGVAMGTVAYMSPEQALGEELDERTDLFSLGAVLYEMATGRQAFGGSTTAAVHDAILNRAPAAPLTLNPELPAGLEPIINKALEKDRNLRYARCKEILADLERLNRHTESGRIGHAAIAVRGSGQRNHIRLGMFTSIGLAALACTAWLLSPLPPPKVLAIRQLTRDGISKGNIVVSDGSRVYVTEGAGNSFVVQASQYGGETSPVPTPFPNAMLEDIAPDGSQLMVRSFAGTEPESPVWALPLPTGPPRRLPEVFGSNGTDCDAAWSPDGRHIAFVLGSELFLTNEDGTGARKLTTVPGTMFTPRFSPDGGRIRFTVINLQQRPLSSVWEIQSTGSGLHNVFPNAKASHYGGSWSKDGRYYFFLRNDSGLNDIYALRESTGKVYQLTSGPIDFGIPISSSDGKELFAEGSQGRGELVKYDGRSGQFVPFLGGISAGELDFSRDGRWVAYISYPENTLWRSRVDGTERLQLTYPPMMAALPRWSPDARKIAFTNITPERAYKVYVVAADGGIPPEEISGTPSQFDPAWSPDGGQLFVADTPSAARKVHIQMVDIKTHEVTELPGSVGLYSPRSSPDGRYLAALSKDSKKVMLYDFRSRKWSLWVEEAGGIGFTNWSLRGSYLYYDTEFSNRPTFRRVKVGETHSEFILDIKNLRIFPGSLATWSGVAPDNSALFVRDISIDEIYALDVRLP